MMALSVPRWTSTTRDGGRQGIFWPRSKLATRNLPADAVDKVQVFDKKSDQAIFFRHRWWQRQKSINLELKEEKRHARLAMTWLVLHDNRFQAKTSINRFDKGNQLSFLGMGNNINEQGSPLVIMRILVVEERGGGGLITVNTNNNTAFP